MGLGSLWTKMGRALVFLGLALSSSTEGQSDAAASTPAVACPLNFTILDLFPYVADTVKGTSDLQVQCASVRAGLEMVLSVYLRESGFFLPPAGTASLCLDSYEKQLVKQGIKSSLGIVNECLGNVQYERGADVCNGIQSADDFQRVVPQSEMLNLNSSCSVSLTRSTDCGVCNVALLAVSSTVQQLGLTNSSVGCHNITIIYTAGIINVPGPLDPGTALCLLYIRSPTANSGVKYWLYISAGVGGILLLSFLVAVAIYCRFRKRREVKKRARAKKTAMLMEASKIPYSCVNWFSMNEIQEATRHFSRENLVGSGGYGNVYKGTLRNGTIVAVKRFKNCSPAADADFLREVELISSVRHKHLVRILGCCVDSVGLKDGHQRIIVFDYLPNGSLQDHLHPKAPTRGLDWPTRTKIALGVAKGLAYLHHSAQPSIIHRDIKPANILLDTDFNARLADFGLAKFNPDGSSHLTTKVAGTHGYVAPEYAFYGQITEMSDVYSFGMVLLELVTGKKALLSTSDNSPILLSEWASPFVKQGNWKAVIDPNMSETGPDDVMERFVLVGLLCAHPHAFCRPTIDAALKMLETNVEVPFPDRPPSLISKPREIESAGLDFHDRDALGSGTTHERPPSFMPHERSRSQPLAQQPIQDEDQH